MTSTMVNGLSIVDSASSYNCDTCNETFIKKKSLKKHVSTMHDKDHLNIKHSTGKVRFQCQHCERSFRKERALNLHVREDHSTGDLEEGVEVEASSSEGEEEENANTFILDGEEENEEGKSMDEDGLSEGEENANPDTLSEKHCRGEIEGDETINDDGLIEGAEILENGEIEDKETTINDGSCEEEITHVQSLDNIHDDAEMRRKMQ